MRINSILFLLLLSIICNNNYVNAQSTEVKVGSNTYIHNATNRRIYNKKNHLKTEISKQKYCDSSVSKDISYNEIFQNIFSQNKLSDLARKNIKLPTIFYCNASGEILEVEFLARQEQLDNFPISDLSKIETAFKGKQIIFRNICPDVPYYRVFKIISFDKL